ncbi:MAG: YifB family Mg chelatase-like AAA ATPase, partial [Lachnospira sp.]|nr:YifB family Mg chelatase-like AAA ATPase [Lachnospira sp.]
MFSKVCSVAVVGIDAMVVSVEVDVAAGIPYFDMTGYLAVEVREAKERVKAAIKNAGVEIKPQRVVVNMSPADVRKSGTGFDLPIALGILIANDVVEAELLDKVVVLGELSLDGAVKGVKGVLAGVIAAKDSGIKRCIVPVENLAEAACVDGIEVYGVEHLARIIDYLNGCGELIRPNNSVTAGRADVVYDMDFSEVYGQVAAKRATLIAVAGMHNLMYVGAPGSGKTMMAMRIPTIMPDMSKDEVVELTRIYSVAGMLDKEAPRVVRRPFRNPHHSVTMATMLGGGAVPRPGEITLANGGVLFLDELTEFPMQITESLRQPLEDRKIRIDRLSGDYEYPADFMLVAAINPCQCGYYPDRNRCNCSENEIKRYLGKISRPLWDRFDMNVHVQPIDYRYLQMRSQ